MQNSQSLVKPKITDTEQRIIKLVTDSLASEKSRRSYAKSLEEFFVWFNLEGRPELNKALINRYKDYLIKRGKISRKKNAEGEKESAHIEKLSSSSINLHISAIRKFASEAEDNNLLDKNNANSIRAVKGVPSRGTRTGNWLTKNQVKLWLEAPDTKRLVGLRDLALLGVLFGCGLRRTEATLLSFSHIEQRDGRWAIVDIVGKRDKMRTVPMPSWTKALIDRWTKAAGITEDYIFRWVNKGENVSSRKLSDQAVYKIVTKYAKMLDKPTDELEDETNEGAAETANVRKRVKRKRKYTAPHDLRRTFGKLAHKGGSPIDQIQLSLGHDSIQTTEKYLGIDQDLTDAPCDHLGISVDVNR